MCCGGGGGWLGWKCDVPKIVVIILQRKRPNSDKLDNNIKVQIKKIDDVSCIEMA